MTTCGGRLKTNSNYLMHSLKTDNTTQECLYILTDKKVFVSTVMSHDTFICTESNYSEILHDVHIGCTVSPIGR